MARTAKKTKKTPSPPATQKFFTNRPNISVTLFGVEYSFDNGVCEMPTDVAEKFKDHELLKRGFVFHEDDAVLINGVPSPTSGQFRKPKEGEYVFRFHQMSQISVPTRGGEVIFANHYATVSEEQASSLRNHTFMQDGRMSEIDVKRV